VAELRLRRVGDATEDVGEPSLWIDAVELCGVNEGEHERGGLGSSL
jgi:hypothetical protein